MITRRDFVLGTSAAVTGLALTGIDSQPVLGEPGRKPLWKLSLAQWSLHKEIFSKKLDNLDFAKTAKSEWGIDGVEYVNQFFKDKANDKAYLGEMKKRAEGEGVHSLLIMVDGEGQLGDPDDAKRKEAVENHHKWVEAAKFLGCHAIRVNAASGGTYQEQVKLAADGLRNLSEFGAKHDISVIVENHGGLSSNGAWLAEVIRTVDHKGCGTLPDFGNFGIDRNKGDWYDRYTGTKELMPYARAVSAKTYDFDDSRPFLTIDSRWNKETDFLRMMKIVLDAGYHGYVGIEYEGQGLPEREGIRESKELLDRVHAKLS
ncbi:MAG: sugar phosphate isomerase/epimerase [Planctomycetota bacterium]|nr:sugar phosphate isomerase/epimerase [Planctomycetota bacterium]